MEKILRITEETFEIKNSKCIEYNGFIIETTEQKIKLGISNEHLNWEDFGYLMSHDDLSDFIGADLINITGTDTKLESVVMDDNFEGGIMYINILTSEGLLQFVAYNERSSYYAHDAVVVSKELNHSEWLR